MTTGLTARPNAWFAGTHLSINRVPWGAKLVDVDAGNPRNAGRAFTTAIAYLALQNRPVRTHGQVLGIVSDTDRGMFNGTTQYLDTHYIEVPGQLRIEQILPGIAQLALVRATSLVVQREHLDRFKAKLAEVESGQWVVLSGSVAPGIADDVSFYIELIRWLQERGVLVMLDARKETLRGVINAGIRPDGLKANTEELSHLVQAGINPTDHATLVRYAQKYNRDGLVIFSLGPLGTFFYYQGKAWLITVDLPNGVQYIHPNGCGDTVVGTFMAGLTNGESVLFSAVFSVAAAVAQIASPVPGHFDALLVSRLMSRMSITVIE